MSDIAYRAANWSCLATDVIPDLHFCASIDAHQCFPESEITDAALALFRAHYQTDSITREAIFHYLYALLHHPAYRERYAEALKKELPRIPFAPDFAAFARIGERLMDLHIHYESAEPYPLKWTENPEAPYSLVLDDRMRLSKDRRSTEYNRCLTLTGIPPETYEYRLGHRSALEWVIDQYRVKRDEKDQITSDPNRPDDPEYILRLSAKSSRLAGNPTPRGELRGVHMSPFTRISNTYVDLHHRKAKARATVREWRGQSRLADRTFRNRYDVIGRNIYDPS